MVTAGPGSGATLPSPYDGTGACAVTTETGARRRGVTLERAIYDAVLEQMNAVGFAGLTMEGVAAAAHTGKAALYRRWQSKEDLVVDALDHLLPSFDGEPDLGGVRADIGEVLRRLTAMVNSPTGCAILALMGELDREHEFVQTLHTKVLLPRKTMMIDILQRAAERGEVRPDAVDPFIADVGPALVLHRLFMYGPPIGDDYVDEVLDKVVMPLIATHHECPAAKPAPRKRGRTTSPER